MTKLGMHLHLHPICFQSQFLGVFTEPTHPAPTSLSPVMTSVRSSIWTPPNKLGYSPPPQLSYTSRILLFPSKPQYPLKPEGLQDLQSLTSKFLSSNILKPTNSPFDMPILPVKKPDGSYRLVQDLRIIEAVVPIHPVSTIPPFIMYFTVSILKTHFSLFPSP